MKVNVYYGGRGLLEDPTLFVVEKIIQVLQELRVEVTRYNMYEDKSGIATLPNTLKDCDGVILAASLEWFGIGGYMQQFLDMCWLYGDKEKIASLYMMPVVVATAYGEQDAELSLRKAWDVLGGISEPGIATYVDSTDVLEQESQYLNLIEKKAEDFYRLINKISDADIVDGARDFRLMKRSMVDAIVEMGEYNRFSKGIFGWIGFKTYWLPYENVNRVAGETKWNFWKLFKYAIDGVINFSQAPLSVASWFGMFMTFVSFVAVIFIIVRKLIFGDPVDGWASTVCIITLIGGIQLFCMGIMGQYIAKTYLEVKKRPHYIVSDTNREGMEKVK